MPLAVRLGAVVLLLFGSAVLLAPTAHHDAYAHDAYALETPAPPPRISGAPAQMGTDGLTFSEDVDSKGRADDPQIEFSSSTERVWTSFAYRDYSGEAMTYLVRANGEDWRWGDLDCCESAGGQFAFPIERRSGNDLGGAAYDVFIYANNAEVGHSGFGVRGTRGFGDSGNDND